MIESQINVESIPVGPFEVNCILLWKSRENAIIIDAGDDADAIAGRIRERGLSIKAQLLTHGHMDHISAAAKLQSTFPAPVYLHSHDAKWAFTESNSMPPYYPKPQKPENLTLITPGSNSLNLGFISFDVLETPGHSPGSVCFLLKDEKILIAGDTLFEGSVGRTDLPGGDPIAQRQSLLQLTELSPELRVICGHGPETTIKRELNSNPYLLTAQKNY